MAARANSLAQPSSPALTGIGIFLSCGSAIALLAGVSLIWKSTVLDRMWLLNPLAYQRLASVAKPAGASFVVLSVLLASAAVGWFKRRQWGWRLTVAIVSTQILGDLLNLALGRFREGASGLFIAGALLFYLLLTKTRCMFSVTQSSSGCQRNIR